MGMTSLNISLPVSLKHYVERQVEAGGYSTPSEYLRVLLREDLKRQTDERIKALVLEGLRSEAIVADEKYWKRARRELAARLKQAKIRT